MTGNINNKFGGKIVGIRVKSRNSNMGKVHNAKVTKVTNDYFWLFDFNKGESFKYKKTSVVSVNCG